MDKEVDAAKALLMMTKTQPERDEKRERFLLIAYTPPPSDNENDDENNPVLNTSMEIDGDETLIKMTNFNVVELKMFLTL